MYHGIRPMNLSTPEFDRRLSVGWKCAMYVMQCGDSRLASRYDLPTSRSRPVKLATLIYIKEALLNAYFCRHSSLPGKIIIFNN